MNQRSLFGPGKSPPSTGAANPQDQEEDDVPAGQTRAEAVQRLQVGLFGIGSMVLLVGLASIIGSQADLTDESAVPEAAPTTEPSPAPLQANPLADAGVVPDIAAEPSPVPSPEPLDLPPRPPGSGNATPQQ
ncbi:MAG TPA: hypothetical protein VLA50_04445 [Erythrobacter sp.]|nr:hypothetical protein [Erythrobacter sp.]